MQRIVAGYIALVMMLTVAGCSKEVKKASTKEGPSTVKVRYASLGIGDGSIPLLQGIKKGFFTEQGIDIEIRRFRGGPEAITGAAAGEADIGSIGTPILIGAAKGVPIKIIGSPVGNGNSFILVARPQFKTIESLKGKKIGGGNPGGGSRQAFIAMTRSKGLGLLDFKVLDTGSSANAFAALQAGQLDATITTELFGAKAEIEGFGRIIARAADAEQFKRYQHTFFFASNSFIDKNPEAISGFLKGYKKSIEYVKANKEESIQFGVKELELEEKPLRRAFDRTLARLDTNLAVDLLGTNNAIKALKELGDLDKSVQITAEQLVDSRFLPL
jgi:ABC-type nitrate/sulfonate/bicarbonate transport system substrate-binding protein